jgi:hypothetical protein
MVLARRYQTQVKSGASPLKTKRQLFMASQSAAAIAVVLVVIELVYALGSQA